MSATPNVPTAKVDDLNDDVVLLDVRRDDEWAAGHASGAMHIPDDQLAVASPRSRWTPRCSSPATAAVAARPGSPSS